MDKIKIPWFFIFILTLTVAAYANSFAGVFQFDDWNVIVNDSRVQSPSTWWQSFPHLRTLFKLSVAVNNELDGLIGFHAVNLALHLLNCALLFHLLAPLLAIWAPTFSQHQRAIIRLLTCTVFALHPVQTEVVTYLSGRSHSLSLCFVLLSLICAQRYIKQSQRLALCISFFAYAAAVASRETSLLLPLLLMLLLPDADAAEQRRRWRHAQLLHSLFLLMALVAILGLESYRAIVHSMWAWPALTDLLAQQSQSLAHLFAVFLFIEPLNADPQLLINTLDSAQGLWVFMLVASTAIAATAITAATLLGIWLASPQRSMPGRFFRNIDGYQHWARPLSFCCLWLLYAWLPSHSLLLRDDAVNDRQWYAASIGLAFLISAAGVRLAHLAWQRMLPVGLKSLLAPSRSRVAIPLIAVTTLALPLACATVLRNQVYASEVRFWYAVVEAAPTAARPWNNLGFALACAGQTEPALSAFATASALAANQSAQVDKAASNLRLLALGRLPCPH